MDLGIFFLLLCGFTGFVLSAAAAVIIRLLGGRVKSIEEKVRYSAVLVNSAVSAHDYLRYSGRNGFQVNPGAAPGQKANPGKRFTRIMKRLKVFSGTLLNTLVWWFFGIIKYLTLFSWFLVSRAEKIQKIAFFALAFSTCLILVAVIRIVYLKSP